MVIAPRSVHVDQDGNECSELDARVARMVVAAGCAIDEQTALRYGLLPGEYGDPDAGEAPALKPARKPAKKAEK